MVFNIPSTAVVSPKLISPIVAPSHYTKALGEKEHFASMETTDTLYRVVKPVASLASVGQLWEHKRLNQELNATQIKNPHYLVQASYEFDIRRSSLFNRTMRDHGVDFLNANQKLVMQAIAQTLRNICWFGAGVGEGLLNGVTNFVFGNDPTNNGSTLETYSPNFLSKKLLQMARMLVDESYNAVDEIVIFGSNRVINAISTQIQNLMDSQKDGGGVDSTSGLIKRVLETAFADKGLKVSIYTEPKFMGAGGNANTDKLVMIAPRVNLKGNYEQWEQDINALGELNTQEANTIMDFGAETIKLTNINVNPNKPKGEGYAVVSSGLTLRKEAVVMANLQVK